MCGGNVQVLKRWARILCALCALAAAGTVWGQAAQTFDIFEYQVEGASLLPVAAVEEAVYPFLGEGKSLDEVEGARTALEKAYHDAGYLTVLVTIPQQKISDATVRLAAIEAPVDRLRVVESRYFSPQDIKAAVPELAEGNVVNFAQMQQELGTVNRSTDRRVSPLLRPGKTPGTVEVELKVQDELPLHGSVEANNRYSEGTSPNHVSANIRWDNLWGAQHSLGLTYQNTPQNPPESRTLSLNYTWPLASGDILALYAVRSDSDVAAVGTLNVVGNGAIYGARYIMPLPGGEGFFQTATLGMDYKDFKQSVNLIGSGGFNTPIHYLPMTLGWDGNLQSAERSSRLGLSLNFHAPGTAGNEQEFADKRFKGKPGYSYIKGSFGVRQTLPQDWAASVRGSWQWADQALVSNEQFAIGGADSVRGYYESAATGEAGTAMSLELSTPNIAKWLGSEQDLRALLFVDGGGVRVIDPITATDKFELSSYGLGLRLSAPKGLSATLDWARARNDLGTTHQGDTRLHFRVGYDW